ncbi:MAG: TatD family hydrolase [Alistipes senegalensis]|nr:TatD family hydrolase [Bacteroides cellulosilyticus]MCM1352279.1 TatD family hydrolase [Alistipes senegalensis]
MESRCTYTNIHTHRPTGRGIELRTAGVHPYDADRIAVSSLLPLADEVQAIGETGLDFAKGAPQEAQYAAFRAQLELARQYDLPVVLHCVRAFEAVMRELHACPPRAAIFHGFIGSPEQARQAIAAGYYLSFGERTFRSPKTIEAMRRTPLTQLFLETDDSPTPIEEIYRQSAEVLGMPEQRLQEATFANYKRIFG